MSSRDAQLAVLLRHTQWALDEAAHAVAAGRASAADREAVALVLDQLAAALRQQESPRKRGSSEDHVAAQTGGLPCIDSSGTAIEVAGSRRAGTARGFPVTFDVSTGG